jgi:glutamate 5-kinase
MTIVIIKHVAGVKSSQAHYRRFVVKLGTNLVTGGSEHLDFQLLADLAGQVAQLHRQGLEVIVVSSGAIAAGRDKLGLIRERKDVPFRQVLAAVGQSRLMQAYDQLFSRHDITIAQTLLTRADISDRLSYLNARNTLLALLELKVIPVVNENDVVAVDELEGIRFGDNDNLSAMVANLVDADLLMLLGDVAGLYTRDPNRDPDAKLIPKVARIDASIERLAGGARGWGTGGMVTKLEAAKLATASGVAVVIADGREPKIITRLSRGESSGTLFSPTGSKLESRKRWMLSQPTKGGLLVDPGAVLALREQNKSLLPRGIIEVNGQFERGDIVNISGAQGEKIACGISNYGSKDIAIIKGAHSDKITELLGYEYGAEVVHKNNLVVL